MSKQGYHKGSTLIICPSCHNRHVISDNLGIFGDRKITVEELLREKGQLVKWGSLNENDDIEFWQDTSVESTHVGEAGATSAGREEEGGEGEDEARRLRETRDPSSQATDLAAPAPSVLRGDSGSRPSPRGASHQDATPSTRRQYHTTPVLCDRLRDGIKTKPTKDLAPWQLKMIKKFDRKRREEVQHEMRSGVQSGVQPKVYSEVQSQVQSQVYSGAQPEVQSKAQSEVQFEVQSEVQSEVQHEAQAPASTSSISELVRKIRVAPPPEDEEPAPAAPLTPFEGVRKVGSESREFGSMVVPQVRRVLGEMHYHGPRFVQLNDDKKSPVVQVKPGIIFRRRPPGGLDADIVAALPDDPLPDPIPGPHSYGPPDDLRNISQRRGFFRPSGIGPVPNCVKQE